jgi:hypothetical protein
MIRLKVVVVVLGIGTENRDVDALSPLAGDLGVVVDLQVVPVKAVALDELAQRLLHQQLLGRGALLVAGQDIDEKVIRPLSSAASCGASMMSS